MPQSIATLQNRLQSSLESIEAEAARLDQQGGFPVQAFALLRDIGALSAPLPASLGGFGLGTEPAGALGLLRALRLIGQGSLAVGRLYEGHVNAIKLVMLCGNETQRQTTASDVHSGHLFAIWVTGGPAPLRLNETAGRLQLTGEKRFASGALHVTRPLVTATDEHGNDHMLIVPLGSDRHATETPDGLSGMRAACTGSCDFTGIELATDARIGQPGDYLRQPEFSAGAWRGIAVALGGIDRLVALLRQQLHQRGRNDNPHQQIRIGEALIARETAAMWATRAATIAEAGTNHPGDVAALVNLARIAAEQAGLDIIRLLQRGLGLAGFLRSNPAERVMRDLATYLRQPAPDETLTEAAAWFTTREPPE